VAAVTAVFQIDPARAGGAFLLIKEQRMYRILALAFVVVATLVLAADPKTLDIADMPPAIRMQDGIIIESSPFGGGFSGRALWLSANGRYAALFRVTDDTDKNGELNIEFGMHGESSGDELALDLFDIETGQFQRYDDLLSGDPSARYVVLRRGDDTLLFDSADGSVRNLRDLGGGASADRNRCMTPRQIVFDSRGEQIALLNDQPAELIIYTIATGKTRVAYRPTKRLWRVHFTANPSWMLAIEATGEFPIQRTSCVSRSRRAFAMSYSTGPLRDGEISYALIGADGRRHAVNEAPVLLGASSYALHESGKMFRIEAGSVEIPEGCNLAGGADGSRVALLACGKSLELFDPESKERKILPDGQALEFIEGSRRRGADGTWYAVSFPIEGASNVSGARERLGRVRLEDLRIERGPALFFTRLTNHPEWLVGGRGDDYFLMHVSRGTLLTAHAKDTEAHFDPFALNLQDGSWLLLDPANQRQARLRAEIEIGNGHGCFLAATPKPNARVPDIGAGPWTRYCVGELR
jgi:hypothetical protein